MITTFGRYTTTLPLALLSIINQTVLPKTIVLIDDNKEKKFYEHEVLKNLLSLMRIKNINFEYYNGQSKGQILAQQIGLSNIKTDWYLSTDDDNILEPNVIELFINNISDNIGAMSGLILSKQDVQSNREIEYKSNDTYNKLKDIFRYFNIQMCPNQDTTIKKVEHIYSNYFIRTKLIDSYPLEFLNGCHRSETVLTHEVFRKGYDLIVDPKVKIWHLHSDGGNRSYKTENSNDKLFVDKLKLWKTDVNLIEDRENVYEEREDGTKWLIYKK